MSSSGKKPFRPRVRVRGALGEQNNSTTGMIADKTDTSPPVDRDYQVGYGRPPRQHQFKPGQSGNPKGRPKGARSEKDIINGLLSRKISIQERGLTRQITVMEGTYRAITQNALKGDLKAASFLVNRRAQLDTDVTASPAGMSEDDRAVFDTYVQQVLNSQGGGSSDDDA